MRFLYEDANYPNAITSVIDGNGTVYKEITYYDGGRVSTSSLNGGIDIDSFGYPEENVTVVTNSLGKDTIYHFADFFGKKKVTLVEGVATASCLGANKNYTYYPNGQLQTRTDWKGQVTRFEYNSRGLEIKRTEAEGTTEQRVTDTTWHTNFNLPITVTAAGQVITNGYNTNGQLISRMVGGNSANQIMTYTYNASGLIETSDGPRIDVTDITSYTYNTNDQVGSITNALGQVIQIDRYSAEGLPEIIVDANGITTELSYQNRGWLSEQRIKHPSGDSSQDAVTALDYDDVGQITKTTLPDGSYFIYTYDDARRVTRITNSLGESIAYTLDSAGNRTAETIYSATNEIKLSLSRQFDELSRLRDVIGANNQTTQFDYDVNDNRSQTTNGRGYSSQEAVDALDRIITMTDANGNPVQYGYNQLDQVTGVTDQRGNTTTYAYNGLGQLTTLDSPDTGTSSFVYDDAGNLVQRNDARGIVTLYAYDALNRVVSETIPSNPALDKTYRYDQSSQDNYGAGRLTGIEDVSGLTTLSYDFQGRVSNDGRIIANELYNIGYQYDKAGNVTAITYPSGRSIYYERNPAGQVTRIRTSDANGETTLADSISYLPFGPVSQLSYGNGLVFNRSYDLDYRLAQQDVGNIQSLSYGYDGNNNIETITDLVDLGSSQDFSYDELDRLFTEVGNYGDKTYQYDAVSNRTERVFNFTNAANENKTRTQTLAYDISSNRLVQRNNKAVMLDANGNTISDRDGKRTFDYDDQNRMVASYKNDIIKATYVYNALGQRVVKQRYNLDENEEPIESRQFIYHYDLNGQLLGETIFNQSGVLKVQRHYVWLDNLPIAQITETYKNDGSLKKTELLYLLVDHLNTPHVATDGNQTPVWTWSSDAFGVGKADKDPDGDGIKQNVRLRFPGQYADGETGLYYNYFRDYDRTTGRYVQSDPIGLGGGINTFGYVGGNPVGFVDPEGLFGMWPWGNPLGGNMSAPVPVPTVNASVGMGGAGMFMMNYMSADSGIALDTAGNACFYSTVCNGIGWQTPAGGELGGVLAIGVGELCSGEETSEGVYWSGGEGVVGQGQVMSDGSFSKLLFGVGGSPDGAMAGAGGLSCTRTLVCF